MTLNMRNGYCRIGADTTHKPRSMDHSTSPFPQTPKPPIAVEDAKGERFGVILGRSASVSTSCSSASGGFQITMKRAFSMGRSSSVSERYCRIHDTAITSPIEDDDDDDDDDDDGGGSGDKMEGTTRSKKEERIKIKILKACKRLLRFSF